MTHREERAPAPLAAWSDEGEQIHPRVNVRYYSAEGLEFARVLYAPAVCGSGDERMVLFDRLPHGVPGPVGVTYREGTVSCRGTIEIRAEALSWTDAPTILPAADAVLLAARSFLARCQREAAGGGPTLPVGQDISLWSGKTRREKGGHITWTYWTDGAAQHEAGGTRREHR